MSAQNSDQLQYNILRRSLSQVLYIFHYHSMPYELDAFLQYFYYKIFKHIVAK